MPSDKPRITLRIEPEDMEHLEKWAKQEFLTVPQLTRVIVKRAIASWESQQNKPPASGSSTSKDKGGKE